MTDRAVRAPQEYANHSPRARAIARLLDRTTGPPVGLIARAHAMARRPSRGDGPGIILLRADHLGDWLMATPAIRALRRRYERAEIRAVVSPAAAAAARLNPDLDGGIVFRAPWYEPVAGEETSPMAFLGLLGRLGLGRNSGTGTLFPDFGSPGSGSGRRASGRWDVAVEMRGDPRLLLALAASGAGRRVGFGNLGLGSVLTDPVALFPERDHVRRNFDVLAPLGVEVPDSAEARRPVLPVPEEAAAHARALLAECGQAEGTGFALVAPGSARPHQRWSVEGFAAVADGLAARNLTVLLTGSAADGAVARAVAERAASRPAILAGRTDLPLFAALASTASLLVANDSGAVHVAAAAGCPVVAIFGPTSPALSFPYGELPGCRAVSGPTPCARPCFRADCGNDHGYGSLAPEAVLEACRWALEDGHASSNTGGGCDNPPAAASGARGRS